MSHILLINGPNLNLLGSREPAVYRATTLADIEARSRQVAEELGHDLACFQANAEHELVGRIQPFATTAISATSPPVACSVSRPTGTSWLSWRRTGMSR